MASGGEFKTIGTGKSVLTLDHCTDFGEAFSNLGNQTIVEGEVALAPFGSCPQNLGFLFGNFSAPTVSQDYFNAAFKGKIAIFTDAQRDFWCVPDFFAQYWAYDHMVRADAAGVIFVDSVAGTIPGIWYGIYTAFVALFARDAELQMSKPIVPFLHCSSSDVSSQSEVSNFVTSVNSPAQILESYPTGLNFTGIRSPNKWHEMFQSSLYHVLFAGIGPTVFFIVFLFAMYYIFERLSAARKKKGAFYTKINIPILALLIEGLCCLILGIYSAVDVFWGNYQSSLAGWRAAMLSQLSTASMSSSMLLALSFSDFRQSSKKLRASSKGAIQRFRFPIVICAFMLLALEVLTESFRRIGALVLIGNLLSMVASVIVGIWFLLEARLFAKILEGFSTMESKKSKYSPMRRVLEHNKRWLRMLTVTFALQTGLGMVAILVPWFLWSPDRWMNYWAIYTAIRCYSSFCKVRLLKLQKTRANKKDDGVGGDSSGESSEESATSNQSAIPSRAISKTAVMPFSEKDNMDAK